jgi:hypothetical protein
MSFFKDSISEIGYFDYQWGNERVQIWTVTLSKGIVVFVEQERA